jgi:hypothetical protein
MVIQVQHLSGLGVQKYGKELVQVLPTECYLVSFGTHSKRYFAWFFPALTGWATNTAVLCT